MWIPVRNGIDKFAAAGQPDELAAETSQLRGMSVVSFGDLARAQAGSGDGLPRLDAEPAST